MLHLQQAAPQHCRVPGKGRVGLRSAEARRPVHKRLVAPFVAVLRQAAGGGQGAQRRRGAGARRYGAPRGSRPLAHLGPHHQLHLQLQQLLQQLSALGLHRRDQVLEQPAQVVAAERQQLQHGVALQQAQQRALRGVRVAARAAQQLGDDLRGQGK